MNKKFRLGFWPAIVAVGLAIAVLVYSAYMPGAVNAATQDNAKPENNVEAINALQALEGFSQSSSSKLHDMIGKGGWLHQVVAYTSVQSGGLLPNGKAIPTEYTIETWMRVNAAGDVVASMDIMQSLTGEILQTGYTINGRTINKDSGLDLSAPMVNLFQAVAKDDITRAHEQFGGELSLAPNADGSLITTLVITEKTPYALGGYAQRVSGTKQQAQFSDNGAIAKQQTMLVFEDGTEVVVSSAVYTVFERIDTPPADVLATIGQ